MKADISLAERRRLEREQQAEIRAILAPRHFAAMQEQMAVDAALARLELEQFQRATPAIYAILGRTEQVTVPVPAPVVAPAPESAAPPVAIRRNAPDLPFDLRYHLGLG